MKTYLISVVCSDATTFSAQKETNSKKEAQLFCDGICAVYGHQGKSIYLKTIRPVS
jgi:hypothetical protein